MVLYPLLFESNLLTIVWGGNQLRLYKGLEPSDEPIGESWEVSAVPTSTSIVSNGVYAGKDLIPVINEQPEAILGKKVNEKYNGKLPLLVVNVLFPASGNQYKCLPLWQKTKVTKFLDKPSGKAERCQ